MMKLYGLMLGVTLGVLGCGERHLVVSAGGSLAEVARRSTGVALEDFTPAPWKEEVDTFEVRFRRGQRLVYHDRELFFFNAFGRITELVIVDEGDGTPEEAYALFWQRVVEANLAGFTAETPLPRSLVEFKAFTFRSFEFLPNDPELEWVVIAYYLEPDMHRVLLSIE